MRDGLSFSSGASDASHVYLSSVCIQKLWLYFVKLIAVSDIEALRAQMVIIYEIYSTPLTMGTVHLLQLKPLFSSCLFIHAR